MPRLGASFRDPSGFVFKSDGKLYRQVNAIFAEEFDACTASGLYADLIEQRLLVPHQTADRSLALSDDAYSVIEPETIPFVSYPYEWSFGELRDAALLTLDIQARALARGFTLRDASAYNVQFLDGRPLFIDTLSFERRAEGEPWAAYRQFCEHFLAPLALMTHRDIRLGGMLRDYVDGIPLDLASGMLPHRSWLSAGLVLHLHVHARAKRKYQDASVSKVVGTRRMTTNALAALIESLRKTVAGLSWNPAGTEWADYVDQTNYSDADAAAKRATITRYLAEVQPSTVWDLGANTGTYSRVARDSGATVTAFDIDPAAVERNYRQVRNSNERGLLPLQLDLTNPSPALGWAHRERMSVEERGPADTVMALALVHHLAISNNVPLDDIASYFARLGRSLIIEFVDKSDTQVQRLLTNRPDIFPQYTRDGFERAFAQHFTIAASEQVGDAARWLYLMRA